MGLLCRSIQHGWRCSRKQTVTTTSQENAAEREYLVETHEDLQEVRGGSVSLLRSTPVGEASSARETVLRVSCSMATRFQSKNSPSEIKKGISQNVEIKIGFQCIGSSTQEASVGNFCLPSNSPVVSLLQNYHQ